MMAGPGDNAAAGRGRDDGRLRASHADREQVIGVLKEAFVQGRLSADELDARAGQVYASRTHAELAEVTVDIPTGVTRARPLRDPWRATKASWLVVYALIVPGLITLVALPGGAGPTTGGEVATYTAVTYALFWLLGGSVMVASRLGQRRSGRQVPPRPAGVIEPGGEDYLPVYRARATGTFKAALGQGRLTGDEYDERVAQAAAAQSRAELAALVADLPSGRMDPPARPPTSKDVRIGVGVTIAAASVIAAILLSNPNNAGAFMAFILAAVTLLVAPIVTVGMKIDVRRRKVLHQPRTRHPHRRMPHLDGQRAAPVRRGRRERGLADHQAVHRHGALGQADRGDLQPQPPGHLQAHGVEQPQDVGHGDPAPRAGVRRQPVADRHQGSQQPRDPPAPGEAEVRRPPPGFGGDARQAGQTLAAAPEPDLLVV
jgi:Domain of unknown function (DUF1707)